MNLKTNYITKTVTKTNTESDAAKINSKNASNFTIELGTTTYTYDGTEKKPSVTVKDGSTTLTNNTDYTFAYSNNVNAGTATVTVTGNTNLQVGDNTITVKVKAEDGLENSS